MTTMQAIIQHLKSLPDSVQGEVLDFIEFLESRRKKSIGREEDISWSAFSLASAMRGMEDEETPYTLADVKERSSRSGTGRSSCLRFPRPARLRVNCGLLSSCGPSGATR
jgi:hypothetical protein